MFFYSIAWSSQYGEDDERYTMQKSAFAADTLFWEHYSNELQRECGEIVSYGICEISAGEYFARAKSSPASIW